ncbi:MAG: transporter substrate-binding domain-containing protein [Alcaligenaceae bacterium]|nr:transporter substrate-binding domain-containing protein [Alcaligenaceae bacterium]
MNKAATSFRSPPRSARWRVPAAAAVLAFAATSAGAAGGAQPVSDRVTVGLHYVAPPFVGGSKVRTPEALDADLAAALAERLHKPLRAVALDESRDAVPRLDGRDAVLAALDEAQLPDGAVAVPSGYVARPMAIMRSDTDIKTWEQLKGRTVCLSEGGLYVGSMAARFGALEKPQRAPADSLLALRIGECDAAVHDDVMLKELLKLPEWKKFSASLPPGPARPLTFVLPGENAAAIVAARKLASEWKASRRLAELNRRRVQDIAFEVYLDQVVEDCH